MSLVQCPGRVSVSLSLVLVFLLHYPTHSLSPVSVRKEGEGREEGGK